MIQSMTGYASQSVEVETLVFNLELRSVNSRFLEIVFRLPDELRHLENALRECFMNKLKRGKIECRLSFKKEKNLSHKVTLNGDMLENLAKLQMQVLSAIPQSIPMSVEQILSWPDISENPQISDKIIQTAVIRLAQTTLEALVLARAREGEKLQKILRERNTSIQQYIQNLIPLLPLALQHYRDKLTQLISQTTVDIDNNRLMQEIMLYAQKIDVDEEINRILAHVTEIEHILNQGGVIGKRLDFLIQELNREANTLASKAPNNEISNTAIELKVIIEQMREQVQNIE